MNSVTNSSQQETWSAPVVLVVEDDPLTRSVVGHHLQAAGYEVILVPSAADAVSVAQRVPIHVLILDLNLLDADPFDTMHDGFAVLDWLRRQLGGFRFRVVIHTSQTGQELLERAEERGVFAFCHKRRDMTSLLQCVHDAVISLQVA